MNSGPQGGSFPTSGQLRAEVAIAAVAVVVLIASYLHVAIRTEFLPCTLDCGETYETYIGALNWHRFGPLHAGGLQDFAASPERAAHPTVYTHNPNLGLYFKYLLFLMGIVDIHAQAVWSALPFAAGLVYMYAFIRAVSRSGLLAALCLLNASTLYLLVILWAFHGVRVFSWVLTFAPAYYLWRLSNARTGKKWLVAATMAWSALSLGIDYPFAVFNASHLVWLATLGVVRVRMKTLAIVLVGGFIVPFLLRQCHVAAVMGVEFWAADFLYSALRRIGVLGFFVPIPSDESLHTLYAARNVLKWPTPSDFQPAEWARVVFDVYRKVLGLPFLALVIGWVGFALATRLGGVRPLLRIAGRAPVALTGVVLSLLGAQAVAFAVFGGYFATFYGSGLMPLMVHWIVPVLGMTTYLLVVNARGVVRLGGGVIPVGALMLAAFIGWRIHNELELRRMLRPEAYPGREALREMKGHSFATVWIASAVSAYTHQWTARLQGPRWRVISPHDLPFDPERDFYFLFEADKDNPRYRKPEFLFIPAINVPWMVDRPCNPFGGEVGLPVDGCSRLEGVAERLSQLPLYRRGVDFLIYDLRAVYERLDTGVAPELVGGL